MKICLVLRTFFWYLVFWSFLLLTVLYSCIVLLLNLPFLKKWQPASLALIGRTWGKLTLWASGGELEVLGRENIPSDHRYCVVANHQGNFDIPIMMSIFPWTLGFVAKKELRNFPILGYWMTLMGCVFLDRHDRRQAKEALALGAERVKNGRPMVIFPEGTRSKGEAIQRFKPGSLKMPIRSGTRIIPVTIDGTYNLYERQLPFIRPAKVRYTIHPPIEMSLYTTDMTTELAEKLEAIIGGALPTCC